MRQVITTVYKFNELDIDAQKKAIENYRNKQQVFFWGDEMVNSLKRFCESFNIDLINYSIGEKARVHYTLGDLNDRLEGLRLRKYLINNFYGYLFKPKGYGEYKKRDGVWGYKRRSRCQVIETSCPFTGVCFDDDLLTPIRRFIKSPDNIDFSNLISQCINEFIRSCESDIKHQNSDEYITDHLIANGYEFDESGEIL